MARVTVEDCVDKVDNRFDLVLLASHRSRAISNGAPETVERGSDRTPVVALREIAEETISPSDLREGLIHSLQKYVEVDEPDPDTLPVVHAAVDALAADGDAESYERISEEDLLRGMENLVPPDRADDL